MKTFSKLFLLLALVVSPLLAQKRDLGNVEVLVDKNVIPVRVSANNAELNALAITAFSSHGRYKVVPSGYAYDIVFSVAGPTQVRVDITKGRAYTVDAEYTKGGKNGKGPSTSGVAPATVIHSETVTGTSARNALLRAADVAVVKTNGLGLKGYFASQLTFIRDQGKVKEVCVSDLFFGEAKQLTHDNALALMPRWSPDGSKIIYTSFYKSGFPDVYLLDVNTGRHDVYARFKGTNQGARFSPNGSQVALVLTPDGTSEIYVGNPQGTGTPVRKTRSDFVKSSPCWSPDGGRILYVQQMGSNPQLYVMSAGGAAAERLPTGFAYSAEPDWSRANPNKIACTVKDGGNYKIAIYDTSKRSAEAVSKAVFDAIEPSWLPDGRHLVYTARDRTSSVLCILDTETGQSKRISATNLGPVAQGNVLAR
jgi:TolB protein